MTTRDASNETEPCDATSGAVSSEAAARARAIDSASGVWHFGQVRSRVTSGREVRILTPHPSHVATSDPIFSAPQIQSSPWQEQTLP